MWVRWGLDIPISKGVAYVLIELAYGLRQLR